jgi:hypothetical protein
MTEYTPPGIRNVTEIDSPSVSAILDRPTVIGIIGSALGHETLSETITLVDNVPATLTGVNITDGSGYTTIKVYDAVSKDILYARDTDYVISKDANTQRFTINRKLYTTIPYSSDLVLIYKDSGNGFYTKDLSEYNTIPNPLTGNVSQSFLADNAINSGSNIWLQSAGRYSSDTDYTLAIDGKVTATIKRDNSSNIQSGQDVYVTYTTGTNNTTHSETLTLTGASTVSLDAANVALGVNESSVVVANTQISSSLSNLVTAYVGAEAATYAEARVSGKDFLYTISDNGSGGTNRQVTVVRNTLAPTTMGTADNRANVVVSYEYIPPDYYTATLFRNIADVYYKYGAAINADGSVGNPLSFAAMMAFSNGANEIYCQPIFTTETQNGNEIRVKGTETDPSHWATTLSSIENVEDINVLVPVVTNGNNAITDATQLSIFQKVIAHINNLNLSGQYAIAIFGEDGSTSQKASSTILRTHADSLSGSLNPERNVLISPSSFGFANPVDQSITTIGGQFVAAAMAGMLGARSIQTPLTRKTILNISKVNVGRTESEKNTDASTGLCVVESKNGVIRVRHAITTSRDNVNLRELSAVRAKFFMIESVRKTIDVQIIGQIIADSRAPITVSAVIQNVLETLKSSGTLVAYANIVAQPLAGQPSAISVQWTYSLPYPLNYVDITMSLDTVTGSISVQ